MRLRFRSASPELAWLEPAQDKPIEEQVNEVENEKHSNRYGKSSLLSKLSATLLRVDVARFVIMSQDLPAITGPQFGRLNRYFALYRYNHAAMLLTIGRGL